MVDSLDDCAGTRARCCAGARAEGLSIRGLAGSLFTGGTITPVIDLPKVLKFNLARVSQCSMGGRVQA